MVSSRYGNAIESHPFIRTSSLTRIHPVATASYRLLPTITLSQPIPKALQAKFQACFPPGVVDISTGQVVIANARADTVSREVLRHPEFEGLVSLGRVRDHFICESTGSDGLRAVSLLMLMIMLGVVSVESAGQYPPQELIPESVAVLLGKIREVRRCLAAHVA